MRHYNCVSRPVKRAPGAADPTPAAEAPGAPASWSRPPTIKDVAERAGVSKSLVSRAMRGEDAVSARAREAVEAAAQELGYRPNAVARSLSMRRTRTLGILIPDLMHSFFVEIVAGIEKVASTREYGLVLCSSNEDAGKERLELELLRQRQMDGVVLATSHAAANTDLLQRLGRSLVMIDRDDHPEVLCDRVLTDDVAVGRLATEHLIAQGRRAVAHIAGPPIVHMQRRHDGYLAALHAHGRTPDRRHVTQVGLMDADGQRAMTVLLEADPSIDAVFAANDPLAIGAMKAIWASGRRIPEDIAVIGAGDIAHGDLLRVPLTTVSWSREELGRRAAELILNRIESSADDPPQRIVLPPAIVVRESTVRPRA